MPGASDSPARASLEELLADLERPSADLVAELSRAREELGVDGADLQDAELAFLERRVADRRTGAEVGAAVAKAREAVLASRLEVLLAGEARDPVALFDLAVVGAELGLVGLDAEAARARAEVARRTAMVDGIDPPLRFAAGERWAELATAEEDLDLERRIALLHATGDVYAALATRTGDRALRRLARRARNAAHDRRLQARVERVLTKTGTAALENLSLGLLLAVFSLLAYEAWAGPARWIEIADASICLFFVAEFLFRLALAPARGSWFVRNALTDLLPALPAAAFFVDVGVADATILARSLRFFRVVYLARYVHALRPVFAVVRLVLFLVRGLDAVVRRFSTLLNRDFVFFERVVVPFEPGGRDDPRALAFRALRREHVLLDEMPPEEAGPLLELRAQVLAAGCTDRAREGSRGERTTRLGIGRREFPVEHAIAFLWSLSPAELRLWLPHRDVTALDRIVRIANAPVVRSLPIVRWFRSPERLTTPEARVVDFGRRVALVFEAWRERVLHVADMHGIVTGPQVLDRVASAIVKFSQRPAVRLLLFGGLFTLVRLLVGADSAVGAFLSRFVATPLVVLGVVCLAFLALGRWLKALAGEASDAFKLTSEAQFIGLVEMVKRRHQDEDLAFLGQRVFGGVLPDWEASGHLAAQIRAARTGRIDNLPVMRGPSLDGELYRVALLYLHFLDGATLHETDLKTTEQLLANLSLQNIRNVHLGWSRREHRALRKLSLTEGSFFRGPFVWFRFVTESVAVETAKLVTDYNRNCLSLAQRRAADPDARRGFVAWRRRRAEPSGVRGNVPADERGVFRTTEFNALDFLTIDLQRERHIERVFGRRVLRQIRMDRERTIREIFGTRPLHELPRSRRTLNLLRFYEQRLSRGRVLLAPLYALMSAGTAVRLTVQKVVQIVREILSSDHGASRRASGRAPFAVALRKIQRMKGPTVLEAMRLRVCFDPGYSGAPEGWSSADSSMRDVAEVERDMDYFGMQDRERDGIRRAATENRRRVREVHRLAARGWLELDASVHGPADALRAERAVTIAYMTDRDDVRTLIRAEEWFERRLQLAEDRETSLPGAFVRRGLGRILRLGRPHPVSRWLREHHGDRRIGRRGRGNLIRAWHAGDAELRRIVGLWSILGPGVRPRDEGLRRLRRAAHERDDLSRELAALRAVQSLTILDVGNYRALVFGLGGYAADGEDPALARRMP
ncbi:MAG: hypothetical protein O3C51_12260 [Planctomycetota bacterium]|nr:hypothetical protein [Planctomycetota bacterium]